MISKIFMINPLITFGLIFSVSKIVGNITGSAGNIAEKAGKIAMSAAAVTIMAAKSGARLAGRSKYTSPGGQGSSASAGGRPTPGNQGSSGSKPFSTS